MIRHSKHALPTDWSDHKVGKRAILEADIPVTGRSRLRLKLLVFERNRDLRDFWSSIGKDRLCRHTRGVVNSFACEVLTVEPGKPDKSRTEVDRRYFAVMGLLKDHLDCQVLAHEATHAAFAYAKRVHNANHWPGALEMDEENVCYPVGILVQNLARRLRKARLI